MPYVFDSTAHPEKAVFCFRERFRGVFKDDIALRRLKRRYAAGLIVTAALPVIWFVAVLCIALSES